MTISKRSFLTLALALMLVGFGAGRLLTAQQLPAARADDTGAPASAAPVAMDGLPEHDVPGEDIAALPRFPGAKRVEYRRSAEGHLLVTEVEYVAAAVLDDVHAFYRQVFDDHEWSVADLGFLQGERTFFVLAGRHEASVEIEARGPLIEVEIELSEPVEEPSPVPTSTVLPNAAPDGAVPSGDAPGSALRGLPQWSSAPSTLPLPAPTMLPPPPPAPTAPPQRAPPQPAPQPVPLDDGGDDDGGDDDGADDE